MMWNGFGWGWGLAIMGMIMCVAMMAMMMSHGSSRRTREPGETNVDAPERADAPEHILARRLASGEIDVEEYRRLRDTLQHTTHRWTRPIPIAPIGTRQPPDWRSGT